MLWQSVALWFIECCEVYMINSIYCSVIKHLMHQWIVYHLDHLFSFCCMWYPFIKKTDRLQFSSDDGLCTGSAFIISWRLAAGPSWPNGKLVYAITESQCRKIVLMRHMNLYWLQFIVFDSLFLILEVTKFFIIILLITVS